VTLLELLVVVAIIASLMGLAVPAVTNISRSGQLATGGNQAAEIAQLARQTALSNNSATALVLVTDSQSTPARQAFAILQMIPQDESKTGKAMWRQVSAWEPLANAVFVDVTLSPSNAQPLDASCTFQDGPSQDFTSPMALPATFQYEGHTVSTYKYVTFLPDGSLATGSTARVELVEGHLASATSAIYTHRSPNTNPAAPADYYRITLIAATGRVKIDRP
jgi:Tfp pilus assembly protein FimT